MYVWRVPVVHAGGPMSFCGCVCVYGYMKSTSVVVKHVYIYINEGWNFNSGNYLFTTDTK